jgi:hypothetical protein
LDGFDASRSALGALHRRAKKTRHEHRSGRAFTARANGDLDGDTNMSTFEYYGQIQESTGGDLVLTLADQVSETAPEE